MRQLPSQITSFTCQRRRLCCVATLLLWVLLTLPAALHAQSTGTTGDGFQWSSSGPGGSGVVAITGYTGAGGAVSIPSTINVSGTDQPVTSIGVSAFSGKTSITSVTIPSSVASIGNYAFAQCTSMTSVTIPNGVTSIGVQAFTLCSSLTTVTIPSSVASIGGQAFLNCTSLTSITVDAGNSVFSSLAGVLFNKNQTPPIQTTLIECPGGKTGSYTVPSSVTSIEDDAFNSCGSLTSVTIPTSVASIGRTAFAGCSSLNSVTIPSSVSTIGRYVFLGCTSLTSITVDAGNPAYSSLAGVLFDKTQATLIESPGGKTGSYTIPNTVTFIESYAFYSCGLLTSVTIPSSVTSIGVNAFELCSGLTSVTIPSSVVSIGSYVFSSCSGLTSVTIPSSIASIQSFAFQSCTHLTSVTIPSSVASIGIKAFFGCASLKSAVFLGNAPSMGADVFDSAASGFTVYFFSGAVGFTSPTWNDGFDVYPSVNMGAYSPVAPWLLSYGFPYNANLQSTPNNDGVSLLMSYALNLNPTKCQIGSLPKGVFGVSTMSLTFYAGSAGVTYSVEYSTDLRTWSTALVTLSGPDANNFRTGTAPKTARRGYMRLKVSY